LVGIFATFPGRLWFSEVVFVAKAFLVLSLLGGVLVPLAAASNPVLSQLDKYRAWVVADEAANRALADNILTWQLPDGGFSKAMYEKAYQHPWDGQAPRSAWVDQGRPLGTIDNDATVNEILFLTREYAQTKDERYKAAVLKAFDFLFLLQYPSGGFAQVYPRRTEVPYSNMVTFNDNAMVRVLLLIDRAIAAEAPFFPGMLDQGLVNRLRASKERAIDFILKAQIVSGGRRTVWCAQHDPVTYAPVGARAYELPSKSGSESVGITAYLMAQPPTPELRASIQAALDWFERVKVVGKAYNKKGPQMVVDAPNGVLWYRFYDLDQDVPFFCGRDGVKKYDILQIEEERRFGYSWGGDYARALLAYAASVGYTPVPHRS
jgi:PelA/Pel-15E family pectate lyase